LNVFWYFQTKRDPKTYKETFPILTKFEIEEEITKCGKRVFIDWEHTNFGEFEYISKMYPHLKLKLNTDTLAVVQRGWYFPQFPGLRVTEKFSLLLESGIYKVIQEYVTKFAYASRFNQTKLRSNLKMKRFNALTIYLNVQTVFYIFIIGTGVSLCSFTYEYNPWSSFYQGFHMRTTYVVKRTVLQPLNYGKLSI